MERKCIGCGSILQSDDKNKEGYIRNEKLETASYCERCFKIINYGEYKKVEEKNIDYLNIYKNIGKTNDLVLFLVDIFNLNSSINLINEYITNNIILVLTKKDILPLSVKENKIINYVKQYNLNKNIIDIIVVSSKNNYNLDLLYEKINKHKISKNVYVVGNTNAGKSTLINKMIQNYSSEDLYITTSVLPSTTLSINKINIDENLTLLDTPGFIEEDNISRYVDSNLLKKILPRREIRPVTYQLNEGTTLYSDGLFRLEYVNGEKNSFTIFISNDIIIERINTLTNNRGKDLKKHELLVEGNSDIMINGLCFIKIVGEAKINLYTLENVGVFIRKSLI